MPCADLGCCHNRVPLMESMMPTHACTDLVCILSERGPFSLDNLMLLSSEEVAAKKMKCVQAHGGQKRTLQQQQQQQRQQQQRQQQQRQQKLKGVTSVYEAQQQLEAGGLGVQVRCGVYVC